MHVFKQPLFYYSLVPPVLTGLSLQAAWLLRHHRYDHTAGRLLAGALGGLLVGLLLYALLLRFYRSTGQTALEAARRFRLPALAFLPVGLIPLFAHQAANITAVVVMAALLAWYHSHRTLVQMDVVNLRLKWLLLFVLAALILNAAWLCDDAFVTTRTVKQFYGGYGLRYNAAERVQSYTHPLWMMVLLVVHLLIDNWYALLMTTSLLFTALTLWFMLRPLYDRFAIFTVTVILFISSRASIDYATSGLENPLSALLVVLFIRLFFQDIDARTHLRLVLLAALLMLNRLDLSVLLFPVCVVSLWYAFNRSGLFKALAASLAGLLPLLLWLAFAWLYYGTPLPNTYYAKTNTGFSELESVSRGWAALFNHLKWDPVNALVILYTLLMLFVRREESAQRSRAFALGSGLLFYLLYTVHIGGDFMSGRFYHIPFIASLVILGHYSFFARPLFTRAVLQPRALVLLLAVFTLATLPPLSNFNRGKGYKRPANDHYGIGDEWGAYNHNTSLSVVLSRGFKHKFINDALQNRQVFPVRGTAGMFGTWSAFNVHVVDHNALTDPFLARLPPESPGSRRIGHYTRRLPEGYLDSLKSGTNQLKDTGHRELYERVRLLSRADLLEPARLAVLFNLFH